MAKRVKGFMSEDGTFFDTKAEAEYHDAKGILVGLLLGEGYNPRAIVNFMETNYAEIEAFIKTYQAVRGLEAEREERGSEYFAIAIHPEADPHSPNNRSGKEDAPRTLQQPPHKREHLPDLGRSVSAKEIRNERKKHGTRSRKGNARRVRGSEDLAVGAQTEPAEARTRNR